MVVRMLELGSVASEFGCHFEWQVMCHYLRSETSEGDSRLIKVWLCFHKCLCDDVPYKCDNDCWIDSLYLDALSSDTSDCFLASTCVTVSQSSGEWSRLH